MPVAIFRCVFIANAPLKTQRKIATTFALINFNGKGFAMTSLFYFLNTNFDMARAHKIGSAFKTYFFYMMTNKINATQPAHARDWLN